MSGAVPPDLQREDNSLPATRSPLVAMWALFVGVGLMMLGNGLHGTLMGVRSSIEGFDTRVIGLIQAAYYAGFLVGSRFTMNALGRVGHVRVFAALASMASTAVLIHSVFVEPFTWFAMRLITGFCMAGLYVVVESWLNDQTTPETRGRTLSIYMVVTMGGVTLGQLLLNVADPESFELFVIASVLVSLSLVPMALSEASAPPIQRPEPLPFRTLWATVPTGIVTMFFSGVAAGAMFAMGSVYASDIGMTTAQISLFFSAALIGAVVLQVPIGSLSDRLPRRGVIFSVALIATIASFAGLSTDVGWPALVVMFAIGATSFPLYSLAIAYTNDWIEPGQRVGASALLVMVSGVGAVVGPLAAAVLMSAFGSGAFFWSLIVAHGLIASYLGYRIIARDPVPVDEQSDYQPIPARSGVLAAVGARRPRRVPSIRKKPRP